MGPVVKPANEPVMKFANGVGGVNVKAQLMLVSRERLKTSHVVPVKLKREPVLTSVLGEIGGLVNKGHVRWEILKLVHAVYVVVRHVYVIFNVLGEIGVHVREEEIVHQVIKSQKSVVQTLGHAATVLKSGHVMTAVIGMKVHVVEGLNR